jgi:hypothetical protein
MIVIEDKLISDDVVEKQFVCDLIKCKGGCCEEGDAGAPLEKNEMRLIEENFDAIKPYLTTEGIKTIEEKGYYHFTHEFGWVTPAIEGKMCAYGYRDEKGIIKCGIEKAYNDDKTTWRKPLSCHLYPIKTKKTKTHEIINYQPRTDLCKPGCALGEKLKIPAYQFLKDALIRKYGQEFYETLDKVANKYYRRGEKIDL